MASVGIITNPQSGKDIRRLVALASSFSNHEKVLILRRVLAGLEAAGVEEAWVFNDGDALGAAAVEGFGERRGRAALRARLLSLPLQGDGEDTTRAAALMREKGAACIVVLGGDGTSRAAARGCGSVPLVPLSTGTNNAFPQNWEGTVAGLGAGLFARRPRAFAAQVRRSKRLRIRLGSSVETALIDLAVVRGAYAGARAVWDVRRIESLFLTRCQPGGLGLSAIGASLDPIGPDDPEGLWVMFGPAGSRSGKEVLSPIAPGLVVPAPVLRSRRVGMGEGVVYTAPGERVLAFDGEREHVMSAGERFEATLDRAGPRVVDVPAVLARAAAGGALTRTLGNRKAPGRGLGRQTPLDKRR
ncbi:MAG: NAD(+)/NADH kinase [Candidatus Tectomicrobia bacterium]|nr:NAD(+)/NADH kinase [Candidatus Tectomicrobia bacterium]